MAAELRELAAHTAFHLRLFRALNAEGFQLESRLGGVFRFDAVPSACWPNGGIALPGDVADPALELKGVAADSWCC